MGGMCFAGVFSAAKADFPRAAMAFGIFHQMRSSFTAEAEMMISSYKLRLCHTVTTEKEMDISPWWQQLFYFYHTCHT